MGRAQRSYKSNCPAFRNRCTGYAGHDSGAIVGDDAPEGLGRKASPQGAKDRRGRNCQQRYPNISRKRLAVLPIVHLPSGELVPPFVNFPPLSITGGGLPRWCRTHHEDQDVMALL
jgi:hypothetical protein